ncbi:hypothetical protein ACP0HM_09740 [Escherichia coli]
MPPVNITGTAECSCSGRKNISKELEKFRPDILDACKAAIQGCKESDEFIKVDRDLFIACPDESVDYAVMEKPLMQSSSALMQTGVMWGLVRPLGS